MELTKIQSKIYEIRGYRAVSYTHLSYVEGGEIPRYSPFFIPKMIADMGAGQISMKYGFRGPNYCTVSACASSNNAMIDAMTYIRLGRADIIMTGGSEAAINPPGVGGLSLIHI